MSTRSGAARVARPSTRPAPVPQQRPRPRVITSPAPTVLQRLRLQGMRLAWVLIPLIAVLLGGVVWVNVQRLNLTTQTGRTVDMYNQAQSDILRLRAVLRRRVHSSSPTSSLQRSGGCVFGYFFVWREPPLAPLAGN